MDEKQAGWVLVAGGALIALGSFFPWATVSTPLGSLSRSGLDGGGDGVFTLIGGVALGLIGIFLATGRSPSLGTKVACWLLLFGVGFVWAVDFADIRDLVSNVDSEFALGSIGSGMWVIVVGLVVAVVGTMGMPRRAAAVGDAENGGT